MDDVDAQWIKSYQMAAIAEALEVNTNQIMAVMPTKDFVTVLFTPTDGVAEVWQTVLAPDNDEILRECVVRTEVPGFMDNLKARIDQQLKKEFGDDYRPPTDAD